VERQVSSESGQLAASRPGRSQPQFPHFALQLSSNLQILRSLPDFEWLHPLKPFSAFVYFLNVLF